MERRIAVDAYTDSGTCVSEESGVSRCNQHAVCAHCDFELTNLCSGPEHVLKAPVKEGLAAGDVQGADVEAPTVGDGSEH